MTFRNLQRQIAKKRKKRKEKEKEKKKKTKKKDNTLNETYYFTLSTHDL